jgi:hypothetical protein
MSRRRWRDAPDHGRPGPAPTDEGFSGEARHRGETIDGVAIDAAQALRHAETGRELAEPLRDDEQSWLNADLGNASE